MKKAKLLIANLIILALSITIAACGTNKSESSTAVIVGSDTETESTLSDSDTNDSDIPWHEWSPEDVDSQAEESDSTPDSGLTDANVSEQTQNVSPQASSGPTLNVKGWTTDKVKFRASPAFSDNVVSVLPPGTEIMILHELGEWNEVSYDNATGYVSARYLTKEAPATPDNEEEAADSTETNGSQTEAQIPEQTPAQTTTQTTTQTTSKPSYTVNSKLICIDPGHQRRGDSAKEPNGPGSSTMKARVTGGTTGRTTGVPEYQLNLDIGLKLRDELVARGYQVVMTRETHDVNISNKERAEFATNAGAAITVRIHANGSDNTDVSGALTMAPSKNNPYVANLASDSQSLSKKIIDAFCAETGLKNRGVVATDTMTGINWCTMPVTIIEMGYMTNPSDDTNMQDADFQTKMVKGIANGIDNYFN